MAKHLVLINPVHWLLFLPSIGLYVYVHFLASFSFPIPWGDEAIFLWQALAFRDTNSLLAPELDPSRHTFLMPPIYMVLSGTIFKIFGFSLSFARVLSLIYLVAAFVLLVSMTRKCAFSILSLPLFSAFLLSNTFVVAGNVARMEALLFLVASSGFFFLQRHHDYKGLALLVIGPLIHPNGVYFFMGGVAYWFLAGRYRKWSFTRMDAVFVVLSVAIWLCYGAYVTSHWPHFQHDMSLQLGRKFSREIASSLIDWRQLLPLIVILGCLAYGLTKKDAQAAALSCFAASAWVINKMGQEMWYQVFDALFYLLGSIVLLHVAGRALEAVKIFRPVSIRYAIGATVMFALLIWHYKTQRIEGPMNYAADLRWSGMRLSEQNVAYLESSDIEKIRVFLNSLRTLGQPLYIQFYPATDALMLYDMESEDVRFVYPWFLNLLNDKQIAAQRQPDPLVYLPVPNVYINHVSRYAPESLAIQREAVFRRAEIMPPGKDHVLFQRDETEIWYYKVVHPEKTIASGPESPIVRR